MGWCIRHNNSVIYNQLGTCFTPNPRFEPTIDHRYCINCIYYRKKRPLFIVIEMFQGVINEVFLFRDLKKAEKKLEDCLGMKVLDFNKILKQNPMHDYAGTTWYEVNVESD